MKALFPIVAESTASPGGDAELGECDRGRHLTPVGGVTKTIL